MASIEELRKFEAFRALRETKAGHFLGNRTSSSTLSPKSGHSNNIPKHSSNSNPIPKANTPLNVSGLHIIDLEEPSTYHGSSTTHANSSCRTSMNTASTEDLEQYADEELLQIQLKLQQELGVQGSTQPLVVDGSTVNPNTSKLFDKGAVSSQVFSSAKSNRRSDGSKESRIQPQTHISRSPGVGGRVRGREMSAGKYSNEASETNLMSRDRDSPTATVGQMSKKNVLNRRQSRILNRTKADDESERDLIALQLATTKKFEEKRIAQEKQKAFDALERKRENLARVAEPMTGIQIPKPSKSSMSNGVKKSLFQKYAPPGQPPNTVAELSQGIDHNKYFQHPDIICDRDYEDNSGNPLSVDVAQSQSSLPSRTLRSAEDQEVRLVGRWSDVSGDAEEAPATPVALDIAESYLAHSLQAQGRQKRHAQLLSYEDEADLRAIKKKKKADGGTSGSYRNDEASVPSSQPSTNSSQPGVLDGSLTGVMEVSSPGPRPIPASFEDASKEDKLLFCLREKGIDWKIVRRAMEEETGRSMVQKILQYRYDRMKGKSWKQPQDREISSIHTNKPAPLIGLPALVAKYYSHAFSESANSQPREKESSKRAKNRMKRERRERERQVANNYFLNNLTGEAEVICLEPTGEPGQPNANVKDKRQKRLEIEHAKRKAKLDGHEKEVRAALRRFNPEQYDESLFVDEHARRATPECETRVSSDEDEDDERKSMKNPPAPDASTDHPTTAVKTVSEATLAKWRQENVEASQQDDKDTEELQSENDRELETSYLYYVGRRISHTNCDQTLFEAPQGPSQSELGPFHTLTEANKTAAINVRPTTEEASLFPSGLESINCGFYENGLQSWTTTGGTGNIETFVTREISTTSLPSTIDCSIPTHLYLVHESCITTSTTLDNGAPQHYLTQQPVRIFTTLDLANNEAAIRWFEHATKHLDIKRPLDDIKKVEMGVELRKEVRMMNEDRVGFGKGWDVEGGEGRVWVEMSRVKGPRN